VAHHGNHCVQPFALIVTKSSADAGVARILTDIGFNVQIGRSYREALFLLVRNRFEHIFTELQFADGSWKDILGHTIELQERPRLTLLADGSADALLWAEALNLGAWDVLSRPIDEAELRRIATRTAVPCDPGSSGLRREAQYPCP
jgi:ActR/RegA family two-component response regulator